MIRVLIVDDDALVRAGLGMILQSADDLDVVGEAADGSEVADAVARFRPDVVLMDIRMPRMDGLAATALLNRPSSSNRPSPPNRQYPPDRQAEPPKVIVLTTFDLDDFVFRALQAGAAGFLLKDTPPRELIQAIRVVAAGNAMLSPNITRTLIRHYAGDPRTERRRSARERIRQLTEREPAVLLGVGRGLSNAEIGGSLFLSEATVKTHVSRLLMKLGAGNRVQVAILAHDAGVLDD